METVERRPKKGEEVVVQVEGIDRKGKAVGVTDGHPIVINRGIPGDRVRARVTKRRKGALEGVSLEMLERGPGHVDARCPHHVSCGGCKFQDLSYEVQLELLRGHIEKALSDASVPFTEVESTIGCPEPWNYRNKMELSFGGIRWIEPEEPEGVERDFALGFHAPGRFDRVLDVSECHILFEGGIDIVRTARSLAKELQMSAWNQHTHEGCLRHLVLRRGVRTEETLVYVVSSVRDASVDVFLERLSAAHPEISTLIHGVNPHVADVATSLDRRVIKGPGWITERLSGIEFRISPESFFQTNTLQAERLFEVVLEEAQLEGAGLVYDLYCGAGSISLLLAGAVERVVGFELSKEAVADAEANAARNDISNVSFVAGDLAETIGAVSECPDVLICDPPRAGMHDRVVEKVIELGPKRIVHVSCNANTAARELARFAGHGYELLRARPVDLFPHTPHVECVFTLERKSS